jgi:hypothetical protein
MSESERSLRLVPFPTKIPQSVLNDLRRPLAALLVQVWSRHLGDLSPEIVRILLPHRGALRHSPGLYEAVLRSLETELTESSGPFGLIRSWPEDWNDEIHLPSKDLFSIPRLELQQTILRSLSTERLIAAAKDRAERIVHSIERLPFSYRGFVRLPIDRMVLGEESVQMGRLTVGRLDERTRQLFSFAEVYESEPESFAQITSKVGWQPEEVYLSIPFSGYVAEDSNRDVGTVFIRDEVKALLGCLMVTEMLVLTDPHDWDHAEPMYIFRTDQDGEPHLLPIKWLTMEEGAVYASLKATNASQVEAHRKRALHSIAASFRARNENVLNASRWYFDAHTGSNDLLQLIQAVTALEILFGASRSDNKQGLVQLLASNLSDLIAETGEQRESVGKDIRRVYRARSNAVHAGRNDLGSEPDILPLARELARRAIRKRLNLLE